MNWRDHIQHDESVCNGQACVRGTRIPVTVVLDSLQAGLSIDEVTSEYPSLAADSIRACMAYAAEK
ncbi:MAG: DUF433 domain-containing protein [Phycisphaerales bacterium]